MSGSNPTLLDVASRMEEGAVAKQIVEILSEKNEIIEDATWLECNDGSNHKTTIRSGLPTGTWRELYKGVQPEKSKTTQVKDSCGMLETYSNIDKSLIDISGDPAGFRLSEERGFIEGLNQTFADTLFYGNTKTNPEKFMGLAPRFSSKSAENGQNIIDAAGTGSDNTSIWLMVWGPLTAHCIYPKGSKAGLNQSDKGQVTQTESDGSMFEVMRSHYKWDQGFSLRDWRYVVRVANIDVSDLTKNAASGADICDLMVQALEKVQDLTSGRAAFYVNRTISSYLRRQMLNKANALINIEDIGGKKVMTFGGVPVRRCDAILNTEAAVA